MAITKKLPLDSGLVVTVKELTVGEIRDWLKDVKAGTPHSDSVTQFLHPEIRLYDLEYLTDLKMKHIDELTQSDLDKVVAMCKELNPHFFGMLDRAFVVQK